MNEQQTIAHVYQHHAAAFTGLTRKQRDAVLNAMGACYQQGQQSRPDYNMPPTLFDGDTCEKLTPSEETLKRIFDTAPPIPDDTTGQCEWMDAIEKAKREYANMTPDKIGDWLFGPAQPDRTDELKREIEAMKREHEDYLQRVDTLKREGAQVVA